MVKWDRFQDNIDQANDRIWEYAGPDGEGESPHSDDQNIAIAQVEATLAVALAMKNIGDILDDIGNILEEICKR